jgi:hypothetical protein
VEESGIPVLQGIEMVPIWHETHVEYQSMIKDLVLVSEYLAAG